MLRTLLIERFKLELHHEKKEMPVYTLVVGKNGPALEKAEDLPAAAGGPATGGMAGAGAPPVRRGGMLQISNGHVEARGVTISGFADMLSNMMDRPVIDETRIEGVYNITLDVSMEDLALMRGAGRMMVHGPGGGGPPDPGGARGEMGPAPEGAPAPSIFSAIQKLGLKLEPRKAPLEFIVIDKGNRVPTEN
jgi:uncharacterized protein (TIGR03435 family)